MGLGEWGIDGLQFRLFGPRRIGVAPWCLEGNGGMDHRDHYSGYFGIIWGFGIIRIIVRDWIGTTKGIHSPIPS